MIEIPVFKYEDWYLQKVKRVLVDGRIKDEKKIAADYTKKLNEINSLLAGVISNEDFSLSSTNGTLFEKLFREYL